MSPIGTKAARQVKRTEQQIPPRKKARNARGKLDLLPFSLPRSSFRKAPDRGEKKMSKQTFKNPNANDRITSRTYWRHQSKADCKQCCLDRIAIGSNESIGIEPRGQTAERTPPRQCITISFFWGLQIPGHIPNSQVGRCRNKYSIEKYRSL